MISLLEAIANIATAIIIFFTIRSTFFTMLLPMIVYLIILPIAFLMNTSDNKHRIVEVGWKYIFLNVTGNKYFFSRFCYEASDQSTSKNVSMSENNNKSIKYLRFSTQPQTKELTVIRETKANQLLFQITSHIAIT